MRKRILGCLLELQSRPQFTYLALLTITLIAGMLRFYKLGDWSFWGDEMFTVGGGEDGFNYSLARQSLSLASIQLVVALFGANEWTARLVPALVGIVSVPILYFPLRRVFDARVALVAVLLLAVSPWHLYWSQNARFYTSLLLFYTLALLSFYHGIESDRPAFLLLSLILLGLAAKERLLALFLIPVVLAYLLLLKLLSFEVPPGLRWRNLTVFFTPCLIGGSFFVGPYLGDLPGWLAGFGYANNGPLWILAGVVYYVGIPAIGMGLLGALYFLVKKSRPALFLCLAATLPLLIIVAISPLHYTANRYVFVALTSWLVLAGMAGVELLSEARGTLKILAAGALLFLLLDPLSQDAFYYCCQNGNRDNWKAAFALIRDHKSPGDLVVSMNPEIGDFYMRGQTVAFSHVDLATLEGTPIRAWFVEDMVAEELLPQVHAWLRDNAQLIANFDVQVQARNFKMRVYLYEPLQDPFYTPTDPLVEERLH